MSAIIRYFFGANEHLGAVRATSIILLAGEISWLLAWASKTGQDIQKGRGDLTPTDTLTVSQSGFTALAAPHTSLIPALIAIWTDVESSCDDVQCNLPKPALTWFIVPLLTIPFDVLFFKFNQKYFEKYIGDSNRWPAALSTYQLASSCAVSFYSIVLYVVFVYNKRSPKRSLKLQAQGLPPQDADMKQGNMQAPAYYRSQWNSL